MSTDWLKGTRQEQVDQAAVWNTVLRSMTTDKDGNPVQKCVAWGIPEDIVRSLKALHEMAYTALEKGKAEETRTHVVGTEIEVAFKKLVELMRQVKARFFHIPPLTEVDIVALGLKVRDKKPTPIGRPLAVPSALISYPRLHVIRIRIIPVDESVFDKRSAVLTHIRYGILDSTKEGRLYLKKIPTNADDIYEEIGRKRKVEDISLPAEDAGEKVYFCMLYVNAKGEPGEWGPIFEAIIT
jgi:hypothetical protein